MIVHARYPVGETRVARQAAALIDAGFDVSVICLREEGEGRREVIDGVSVHRLGVRRHRDRGMAFQLLEYLSFMMLAAATVTRLHFRRRFASVQIHNLPDFLVFAGLVPKLTGAAVFLDLHDLMPEFFEARSGRAGLGRRLLELQEKVSCRFADHVITVSEGWRRDLADRGSVPLERSSVVMNLADPTVFTRLPKTKANDEFVVAYHGTFTHRYGVDVMVEAAHLLRDRVPGLRVLLLGDGEQRDELTALVEKRGLEDVVSISDGMLDAVALQPFLAQADVGVVPNRANVFTDGILPTKLMEYITLGLPVIASRTRALEANFDEDMVVYVRPGDPAQLADQLEALYLDADARSRLVEAAGRFETAHSWPKEAASYVGLVRRVGEASPGVQVSSPSHDWSVVDGQVIDDEWDAFAAAHGGHHTQSSRWTAYRVAAGWEAKRIVVRGQGEIVGGVAILLRPVRVPAGNREPVRLPVGVMGYTFGGPVVADDAAREAVFDAIEQVCRAARIRALLIEAEDDRAVIDRRHFRTTALRGSLGATVRVDLSPPLDEVLAAFKSKTRANIRLAERKGVTVRHAGLDEIHFFHDLLKATGERQGFEADDLADHETMASCLGPGGQLEIFFAEVDGQPVAGALLVVFGDAAVYKRGAWSGQFGERRPNEAMHWGMMSWAKTAGLRWYDFDGLEPAAARAALSGDPLPEKYRNSVSRFKLGYAGEIVIRPEAMLHMPNPALSYVQTRLEPMMADRAKLKRLQRWGRRRK